MQNNDIHKESERVLDTILKSEPSYKLPGNFADVVAAKAVRRFAWRQYLREFLVYLYAFFGLAVITLSVAFIMLGADWQVWKPIVVDNLPVIISLKMLILFV